jgi:hypothetical protein
MTDELAKTNDEELAPPEFGREMAFLNPADMPDLDKAEVGISIEPKYLEILVGQSVRGIFSGIGHITKKNDDGTYSQIPAIVLQTKDGLKLHAGASLVSQMQNIPPGTAVQITYSGQEKTGNGYKVNKFDVRLLNVPRVKVPALPSLPAPVAKDPILPYKNLTHKDSYWKLVHELKMTNQEGNDHLKEFGYDFAAAYEAMLPGFIEPGS